LQFGLSTSNEVLCVGLIDETSCFTLGGICSNGRDGGGVLVFLPSPTLANIGGAIQVVILGGCSCDIHIGGRELLFRSE
jgi:hypothetical protein